VSLVVQLQTICEAELWSGFFGIDETGRQPECGCVITEQAEEDSIEVDQDGKMRPCYSVQCPQCGFLLEWPQAWEPVPVAALATELDPTP
jgi:hypothetical protein